MMKTIKETLELALEALEDFEDAIRYDNEQDDIGARVCCDVLSYNPHTKDCKAVKAITALREALAEQPAQQEPVAWMQDSIELYVQDHPSEYYTIPLYTSPPAQQEPVAWIVEDQSGERLEWASDAHSCHGAPTFPLYTSPPAQRKPLTREIIERDFYGRIDFVRAIEAAHGIKENT